MQNTLTQMIRAIYIAPVVTKENTILSVGSMAFDSVSTPEGKRESALGGSVNYFSIAASPFVPVELLAVVGKDYPQAELEWLNTLGISTSGVKIADGDTFHWVGDYCDDLNEAKTLSTFLNVFEHFKPQLSEKQRLSDYVFLGNIDPDLQHSVLDQVEGPKFVGCDSMNFWITGKLDRLKALLERIDLLSINEKEAMQLTGKKNLVDASEQILKMGPSVLILKRGEYGAMLKTREQTFLAPAYPIKTVVDPTGAGDSFAGAMMGHLASCGLSRDLARKDSKAFHSQLRQAVLMGCVMASFTVEDFSFDRLRSLTGDEFKARLSSLRSMIEIDSSSALDSLSWRKNV